MLLDNYFLLRLADFGSFWLFLCIELLLLGKLAGGSLSLHSSVNRHQNKITVQCVAITIAVTWC